MNHVRTALQTDLGSLLAPVCSSYVWINVGTSGRTITRPEGDITRKYVRDANTMVSRVILLLWIHEARGTCWILEQPEGSLMQHHARFQELMTARKVFRKRICMQVRSLMIFDILRTVGVYSIYKCTRAELQFSTSSEYAPNLHFESLGANASICLIGLFELERTPN
jgi:hypothetical protein